MNQALLELGIDLRWWGPALGLEPRAEFGERLGINRIGLGAFEQRLGEIISWAWAGLMMETAKPAATRLLARRIH
jgi:hypothetical protein